MKKYLLFFSLFILFTVQLTRAQVVLDTIGAGSALKFNSTAANYVNLGPAYKTFDFPFSFEAWVYPTSVPGLNAGIFALDNSTEYYGWWATQTSTGQFDVSFGNSYGFGYQYRRGFNTINNLPLNQWTHIAVVCTSVTNVTIYFNGVLQVIEADDGISTSAVMTHSSTGVASIGEIWTVPTYDPFDGQIDEVRLWSDTLSQAAIQQNMCRKIDPNTAGLLGYWRADEADTSIIVYDYTTNGINGTIEGTVPRVISDAPLGNTSTYLYIANWNTIALSLGSSTGDTLTASQISGIPSGVQIYAVNSKPYYTSGLKSIAKSYFGVFCVNGSSPAYTATCHYSLTDGTINSSNQDSAIMDKRIDATDTPWTPLNGVLNNVKQTISKTSQPSPREYILDVPCDISLGVISQSPAICTGQNVTLVVNGGASSFTWSPSAGLSAVTGDSVIANPTVTTTYTLIGVSKGCIDTVRAIVTVNPLPIVIINPQPAFVCSGQSILLTASGGTTYIWSPATTLNSSTGDSVVATPTIQTTYTVTGTDSLGCSASNTDVVTISPAPDKPTLSQNDSILTTNATQGIQWSRNDTVLEGATTQNYTITVAGWYKVVVVNPANGCSATSDSMYFAPTGINQLSTNNSQFSIYPNPSNGKINIASSKTIDELKVFNVLGQLVYEFRPKQTQFTFELKDEGIYFVRVTVGGETTTDKLAVSN